MRPVKPPQPKEPDFEVQIKSVLGGIAPLTYFAREDQYSTATYAIDPSKNSTGLIEPVSAQPSFMVDSWVNMLPMWMREEPKLGKLYTYTNTGGIFTWGVSGNGWVEKVLSFTGSESSANGMEYYDNYMYFATASTVARYGPLNGSPAMTYDYWVGTLGKSSLTNTSYPYNSGQLFQFPNHMMHRHSDGRLYILDVVDNQGTLHFIKTTKTTVEGDTDNGSTQTALQFGYGLWPMAIESYGSSLAIALIEQPTGNLANAGKNNRTPRAKIAFWDTTSQNFNSITWVEFPDAIITALKNVNGTLYIISSNGLTRGFRVSRYVGGNSIEEVAYVNDGLEPSAGAVDASARRLLFGSSAGGVTPVVYSYGLQNAAAGQGLHTILRGVNESGTTVNVSNVAFTAIRLAQAFWFGFSNDLPLAGIGTTGGGTIVIPGTTVSSASLVMNSVWKSQIYKMGKPFKITKIRIPLQDALISGMSIVPKVYVDDSSTTFTLQTIDSTNYSDRVIVFRATSTGAMISGKNNFYLELTWSGTVPLTVGLPIIIEGDYVGDN